MKVESIKQRRERELEATTWYYERTGRHIRNRAHLNKVMRDYQLAKAIDIVLAEEDAETNR
jgi:hypothetical protein